MCCGGGEGMLRIGTRWGLHWTRKGRKKQKRVSYHKKNRGGEGEGEMEKEFKTYHHSMLSVMSATTTGISFAGSDANRATVILATGTWRANVRVKRDKDIFFLK